MLSKEKLKSLDCNELVQNIPDLKTINGSKTKAIANALEEYIKMNPKGSLLPLKSELSEKLGVSIGTIQNVYRVLENKGLVVSKQCIGTIITDNKNVRKLTSKREIASELIKKFIKKNKMKVNDILPSARQMSKYIDMQPNTTGLALECLEIEGVIKKEQGQYLIISTNFVITHQKSKTLAKKIENDLKNYILSNLKQGDKMPSHSELAAFFDASVKTIHDGLNALIKEGILLARRGRYGTSVVRMPNDNKLQPRKETSIFASAQQTAFYHYEKTQNNIINLINEKYDIGSKLPSIMELANLMDVSPNTVRKAFANLAKEGYLRFSRGRYGGTYVVDIPENTDTQAFKWLAVNPQYAVYQEN